MGSVVQIFTGAPARPMRRSVTGAIEGGIVRHVARRRAGHRRRAAGAWTITSGVTHRETDGAFSDILPEDDEFEQTAFDGGVGVALGTRASLRAACATARPRADRVGPINYGSRDTGGVYDTKDLSWHADVTHAVGSRLHRHRRPYNYFRYESRVGGHASAIRPFCTYTILDRHAERALSRTARVWCA